MPPLYSTALWMCGASVVCFALFVLTARTIRRFVKPRPEPKTPAFGMDELQAMMGRGEISPQEYERLRTIVLAKVASDQPPLGRQGFEVKQSGFNA